MSAARPAALTIDDLRAIVIEVTGNRAVMLSRGMSARDVPGWDSLGHTLIILEIAETLGISLDAMETADLPDLGALIDLADARLRTR